MFVSLQVVVVTIEAAMDHKPSHREMASRLISVLVEEMLAPEDMIKGTCLYHFTNYVI